MIKKNVVSLHRNQKADSLRPTRGTIDDYFDDKY